MTAINKTTLFEILKTPEGDSYDLVKKWAYIQNYIKEQDSSFQSLRRIQFMGFEISESCQGLHPLLRYETVRDFFFDKKGFSHKSGDVTHWKELTLESFLETKLGPDFLVGLIFRTLLLATQLETDFVFLGNDLCLKLIVDGHCYYLDLHHRGLIFEDQQVLQKLALSHGHPVSQNERDLEDIKPEGILSLGLSTIERKFTSQSCQPFLVKVCEIQVQLGQNPAHYLIKMAEAKVEMGLRKEAFGDLKRVMSLCLEKNVPPRIRVLYDQLRFEVEVGSSNHSPPTVIH